MCIRDRYNGWKELLVNHQEYSAHPAFVYMVLSQVVESSDASQEKPPVQANPIVLAKMFNKVNKAVFKYNGPIKDEGIYKKILALSRETLSPEKISETSEVPVEKVQQILGLRGKKLNEIANETGIPQPKVQQVMGLAKETRPAADIAAETGVPVDHVQGVIDQNNSSKIDILKTYQKDLNEHSLEMTRQIFDEKTKSGWIKLPMKDNVKPGVDEKGNPLTKEQVWDKNLDILNNFSLPNSWCTTKNVNGPLYLSEGDFWILVENGKGCVGIRFGEKNKKIYEIAGDQSFAGGVSRSCPVTYWREITDLIFREGLEPMITGSARYHWERILKERDNNKSYFNDDGTPNMEEIEELITRIKADPSLYNNAIKNEQFQEFPEIMQSLQTACKEAWFKKIHALQGADAFQLAEDVAQNAAQMPDFVLRDPAFIENVHGRLAAMYQNSPEQVAKVLGKVPNHWDIYPRGKEIFKQAVINKYASGLYWKSNVFSTSRKTKEMKERIRVAKKEFEDIQKAIGDYMPELNADHEFEMAIQQAKVESAPAAMIEGYFAIDMPRDAVAQFFDNPENVDAMANNLSTKISPEVKDPRDVRRDHSVYLDKTFEKELSAIAPLWVRRLPGFQSFADKVKQKVLRTNIDMFRKFEPQFKNDELFQEYKKHMLQQGALRNRLRWGDEEIDPRLLADPDYQKATGQVDDQNINQVLTIMRTRASAFLTLPLETQQNPKIQEAYIAARATTTNDAFKALLVKEFPRLPDFMKEDQRLLNAYILTVINLLIVARPGSKQYLDCKDIDPMAYIEPRIIELCKARGTPIAYNAEPLPEIDQGDIEFGGPDIPPDEPDNPNVIASQLGWYRKSSIIY